MGGWALRAGEREGRVGKLAQRVSGGIEIVHESERNEHYCSSGFLRKTRALRVVRLSIAASLHLRAVSGTFGISPCSGVISRYLLGLIDLYSRLLRPCLFPC